VSPLSLPVFVAVVAVRALGGGWAEAWTAAVVVLVCSGLVPGAVLVALVRSGRAATLEVREQTRRTMPYLAGFAGTLASAAGLWAVLTPARHVLVLATVFQALNTLVLWAVNRRTKVSVHLYAITSGAAFLVWLAAHGSPVPLTLLVPLFLLIPALAWARVAMRAHTHGQVALGAAMGSVLLPLQLMLVPG
jgi:hypothetical protein